MIRFCAPVSFMSGGVGAAVARAHRSATARRAVFEKLFV